MRRCLDCQPVTRRLSRFILASEPATIRALRARYSQLSPWSSSRVSLQLWSRAVNVCFSKCVCLCFYSRACANILVSGPWSTTVQTAGGSLFLTAKACDYLGETGKTACSVTIRGARSCVRTTRLRAVERRPKVPIRRRVVTRSRGVKQSLLS